MTLPLVGFTLNPRVAQFSWVFGKSAPPWARGKFVSPPSSTSVMYQNTVAKRFENPPLERPSHSSDW
eukprot:CAMPEP_0172611626 /NCGR_PEP_ID=MMETSP1068-20121228/31286_1 /TAXON_ID=35684 /ORGANISM="Pseudopedinella elastica, Strain CCMP716" /LENGTH=66 /DNA_ID=CAMNT_0013415653 /DNA_START=173 /DNA_END=373 /DNA_ORIENTATION=-